LRSPIAKAVIEGVVRDLASEEAKERSDASHFFLSGDYVGHCAQAGIDPEWLRRKSVELLSLGGVQRKRAAADLVEEMKKKT
jgi:hypothetical protein